MELTERDRRARHVMLTPKTKKFIFVPKCTSDNGEVSKIIHLRSDNQKWSFIRVKSREAEMSMMMTAVEHSVSLQQLTATQRTSSDDTHNRHHHLV